MGYNPLISFYHQLRRIIMNNENPVNIAPLVSICMVVFNESRFIRSALQSLIFQDYTNTEIIVFDNCSTDGTWEIIQEFSGIYRQVKPFRQITNVGSLKNGEDAVKEATGEYLMAASGHDDWDPSYVSNCVTAMLSNPSATLAYSKAVWIDEHGNPLGLVPTNIDTTGMDPATRLNTFIGGVGYCYQMYGLFRRSFWEGYTAKQMLAADIYMLSKAALLGTFVQVPQPLFYMRQMGDYGSWKDYIEKQFSSALTSSISSPEKIYFDMVGEFIKLIESFFPSGFQRDALISSVVLCLFNKYQGILHGVGQAAGGSDLSVCIADIAQFAERTATDARLLVAKHTGKRKILIDGVFFQMNSSGITRVWRSLLQQWSTEDFAKELLVLDRAGTAPKIAGIRYRTIPAYNYHETEADKQMLQQLCNEEEAALFISSYYTTPTTTPSVFMAYDMIPEMAGWDMNEPMWREKQHAIRHASGFISISANTARDLLHFFPSINPNHVTVAYCGVDINPTQQVADFKAKYGLVKPYFLLVGLRAGYKNCSLFFKAFAEMGTTRSDYDIVCTGAFTELEPEFAALVDINQVHMLNLDEHELAAAYSGAVALVYPSIYEGFGMPVVEAMACGCPVITCPAASIPEVAGDAAIFVQPDDVPGLVEALYNVQQPKIRSALIAKGLSQARKFSWEKMAGEVKTALIQTRDRLLKLAPKSDNTADSVCVALRYYQEGKQPEAINELLKIIAIEPENVPALHLLGFIALQAERYADAELLIRNVIALQPDFSDPHHNLGLLFMVKGNPDEAVLCFETALRLNPNNADTLRKLEEARTAAQSNTKLLQQFQACQADILQNPDDDAAVTRLTDLRRELAYQFFSASEIDQLEILYQGEVGETHRRMSAMGIAAFTVDARLDGELLAYISADLAKGYGDLASMRALLAAMLYFGPHQIPFWLEIEQIPRWLLNDYLMFLLRPPKIFHETGHCEYYCEYVEFMVDFLHAKTVSQPDSPFYRSIAQVFVQSANFTPLYFSTANLKRTYQQRAELIEFYLTGQNHAIDFAFKERSKHHQKIRLGILAPNFAGRSETYATLPVFRDLDRSRYEVILITFAFKEQAVENYCARHADRMVILQEGSVFETVHAIRELDLDVIWIGSNITAVTNDITLLSAHRLARIQLTGGCSPTTTGFHNIDAFASGSLTEPETGAQEHYTEPLLLVDGPALCFDFADAAENATMLFDRAGLNIPDQAIVYASGANYFKIIPELEALWLRILAAVPKSVLLLYPFNPNWTHHYPIAPFLQRLQYACARQNIDVARIVIQSPMPTRSDIKNLLKTADIYLDSFPHSGMTSLIDPLEIGLPTVVLEGNHQRGKLASAALKDLDLTGLIAATEEAYQQLAVKLGRDSVLRSQYRQRVRTQMAKTPKFLDSAWYGKEIEKIISGLVAQENRTLCG